MKYVIAVLALFAILGALVSCGEKPPPRQETAPATPADPKIETPPSEVEKAKAAAKAAADRALKATADGASEVDRLKAEKEAIIKDRELARAQIAEAEAKVTILDKSLKVKDGEITEARDRATQERIYWFAGILGFVALVGGVVALAFPLVRSWAGGVAIACGVMSAVALFAAWLVPYFWWIGGSVVILAVIGFLVAWKGDSKIGNRLLGTMERVKGHIPDYRTKLRAELGDIDESIDRRREKLGLKPKKASKR